MTKTRKMWKFEDIQAWIANVSGAGQADFDDNKDFNRAFIQTALDSAKHYGLTVPAWLTLN